MRTIYKYALEVTDEQDISAPRFAQWLHVEHQHGALCVWALVDTAQPPTLYRFRVIGTGNPAPIDLDGRGYVGTSQDDYFVWHVFQEATT